MKQTIEINVPEGFKAVWNETTQQIDLVKIDNRPRSWEEFCETHIIRKEEVYINTASSVVNINGRIGKPRDCYNDKNWCTSQEEAKAFLALMQLRQLRKAWIGDWEPTYPTNGSSVNGIVVEDGKYIKASYSSYINMCLTFRSKEMTEEFIECFKDLLETAKILL